MKSTLLLILGVSFSCAGMQRMKEEQETYEKKKEESSVFTHIGGIQSLCSAKKDGREIVIVGHMRCEEFDYGPLSGGDLQAKKLLLPFLTFWSTLEEPTAFITFDSESTCKGHAERFQQRQADVGFYLPLHAEINAFGHSTQYRHGNLHILPKPTLLHDKTIIWDVSLVFTMKLFPLLAKKAQLPVQDIYNLKRHIEAMSSVAKKKFFGNNGPFERFKTEAQKLISSFDSTHFTLNDYKEILEHMIALSGQLRDKSTNSFLSQQLKRTIKQLNKQYAEVISYLGIYGISNPTTSLFDALFRIIGSNLEIEDSVTEFIQNMYIPIFEALGFHRLASILMTANQYTQVVLLYDHDKAYELVSFLAACGYDIDAHGCLPQIQPGDHYTIQQSPFSQQEGVAFLQRRFGATPQLPLSPIAESPSKGYTNCHQEGTSNEALPFLQETTDEQMHHEERSYILPEERICSQCSIPSKTIMATSCSFTCLTSQVLLTQSKTLRKLLAKKERSQEEQALLARLGSLCYLRALTLAPISRTTTLPFPLKDTLTALARIKGELQENTSWQRALSIADTLHISLDQLELFLKVYQTIEEQRLKAILQRHKTRSRSTQNITEVFDQKNTLRTLQEVQYQGLIHRFGLETNYNAVWYPRLYYTLMQMTAQTPEQSLSALGITKK